MEGLLDEPRGMMVDSIEMSPGNLPSTRSVD
jgi:hypothetical protein